MLSEDTAIVNGDIKEPKETSITFEEAKKLGVSIGDGDETDWQIIDDEIEGREAVTIWRPVRRWALRNARNGTVTLVELKPKSGRKHQLRRHMSRNHGCPLLGDGSYDGGGPAARALRGRGFCLCANRVTFEHPRYQTRTADGRAEWATARGSILKGLDGPDGRVRIVEENGAIVVHCEIDLPAKFREIEEGMQRHAEYRDELEQRFCKQKGQCS